MAFSVHDIYFYFQRACRRELHELHGVCGARCEDDDGNTAVFAIEAEGVNISRIGYRCTTCCTLVAVCEHLTDLLRGKPLSEAENYSGSDLLELHPEIAPSHRKRAALAAEAVRSAAQAATMEPTR
jgi:hypothetical protein